VGARNFSLHHHIQNGSVAQPPLYPMGTWGSFPVGKVAGAWSWPLTSIQCQSEECIELYLHSPTCLHGVVLSLKKEGEGLQKRLALIKFKIFCLLLFYQKKPLILPGILRRYEIWSANVREKKTEDVFENKVLTISKPKADEVTTKQSTYME